MGVGQLGRLALAAVQASGIESGTYVDSVTLARQEHAITEHSRDNLNVNLICVNADALPHFAFRVGGQFFDGRYTVGLWAWEIEQFPDDFSEAFDLVDEVWALSEFARAAIAPHTDKPVFAFPLPIEVPVRGTTLRRTDLGLPDKPYFLFAFDLLSVMERKNPLGLIKAFREAFEPNEGPTLVIKALSGKHKLADLETLRMAVAGEPDVILIERHLDRDDNLALIELCACYVSLHRSEGFGLTIAEAMSYGRPVIATAYSGNLDFMTPDTSYPVPYRDGAVPKNCEPYPVGAYWAEPDLQEAARLMRYVYEHPAEAEAMGSRARAHIEKDHAPSTRAAFILDRFDAIQATLAERTRFVEHYYAPFTPAPKEPLLPSVPSPSFDRDVSGLVSLVASGQPIDGPSRHPRVARVFRRGIRRLLRSHDEHQRRINQEIGAYLEGLSAQIAAIESGQRDLAIARHALDLAVAEQLVWINDLKSRIDRIGGFVSETSTANALRFAQIDALHQLVADYEERLSHLAVGQSRLLSRVGGGGPALRSAEAR
jgi:glycosyltransferase involved in cell wall biosynthesis